MIFQNQVILLDFDRSVAFKEKTSIRQQIIEHGGTVSYSLNKKVCSNLQFADLFFS